MSIPTPLDRLPDDHDTLKKIKELPHAEEIPYEDLNPEASIDNTSDEDLRVSGSGRDWTRLAVSFLLIILFVMLFIYICYNGIQNPQLSKGSSVPQAVMAENTGNKFKKLSYIMETLKQADEEIEYILSEEKSMNSKK